MELYCAQNGYFTAMHIVSLTVSSICLTVSVVVGLCTITRLQNLTKISVIIKLLFYCSFIICIISILFGIIETVLCASFNHVNPKLFQLIHYYSYSFLFGTILMTLLGRLHVTFKNSDICKISKFHKIILCILFLVMVSAQIYAILLQLIFFHDTESIIDVSGFVETTIIAAVAYLITTVYALTLFVLNLMTLVKNRATSLRSVVDKSALELNKEQTKLIHQISKYVSLLSLAIFTSMITISMETFSAMETIPEMHALYELVSSTLVSVDSTVNILLLCLQYPFANGLYDNYCKCIQALWYCMFSNCAQQSIKHKYKSIHKIIPSNTTTNQTVESNNDDDVDIKIDNKMTTNGIVETDCRAVELVVLNHKDDTDTEKELSWKSTQL